MNLFNYLMNKNNKELVDNDHMLEYLLNNAKLTTIEGTELEIIAKKTKINELIMTKESTQEGTPTPENPIEVKTVKGYRNLFDKSTATYENTILNDNGVASASNSSKHLTTYISVKPNTQYTIQGTIASTVMGFRLYYYDENKGWISRTSTLLIDVVPYTFTTPVNCYYIQFQVPINIYDEDTVIITEGSTALPYVPYGNNYVYTEVSNGTDTNYYTIPLNNNEICGIGDYKDELIVDKNGHCWLNKKIGKVVLNGEENWTRGTNGAYYANASSWNYLKTSGKTCMSQYFLPDNNNSVGSINVADNKIALYNNTTNTYKEFYCAYRDKTTLQDFKNWLSEHNLIVYYVLATPNLIDLNYEIDMTLYKGTNIITNSEDMTMLLKYYS